MAANFGRAFVAGSRLCDWPRTYGVEVVAAGELSIPSGEVLLTDPRATGDTLRAPSAVLCGVPPGRWPTELALLRPLTDDGQNQGEARLAGARIQFVPEVAAVQWELALVDDQGQPVSPYPPYPNFGRGGFDVQSRFMALSDRTVGDGSGSLGEPSPASDAQTGLDPEGSVLLLQPNPDDLVYLWWGRDWGGNVVELVIEVDRLLRETWLEITISADVLKTKGWASNAELDAVGVTLEVLDTDEFCASWNRGRSGWPAVEPPDVAVAFRTGTGVSVDPLDAAGKPVYLGGASTTRDGWALEYWKNVPAFSQVTALRLRVALSTDQ